MPKRKLPAPLTELMARGWAAQSSFDATLVSGADHHARARTALSEAFKGWALVVPTGGSKAHNNDAEYDFRPGSDFAYLTGHYEPDAVLVLFPAGSGHEATLYLRPRADRSKPEFFTSYHGELWTGPRLTLAQQQARLGVLCADLVDLTDALAKLDPHYTAVLRGLDDQVDTALPAAQSKEASRDGELAQALAELRLVKNEWEIQQLDDAISTTLRGFADVVRALPADQPSPERLVEGVFGLRARLDGNAVGYCTIAAAGAHACTLHWACNTGICRPGELLLLDAGVENAHLYTADITRTFPISGEFTPAQRQIYDIVYAAQQAGIAAIKPGVRWSTVARACTRVLAEGLARLDILPVPPKQALRSDNQTHRRWTLHGFGHMLGLDVHDCTHARKEIYRSGKLNAGYVLTVEPGLYFQPDDELVPPRYRGIGVRIEDNILVTDEGCRVLSRALPSEPEALLAWMRELRAQPAALLQDTQLV
ncbi:MAG: aminopeptidase P family protein [Mycobacteriales bacterium]